MFIHSKFQTFILTTFLISAQNIYAKPSDLDRVNTIAQSMIGLFSMENDNQDVVGIPLAAAIADISEAEAKTRRDQSDEIPFSTSEKMLDLYKEQFNEKDFKIVAPAFKRQLKAQGKAYKSCKKNGDIIEKRTSYEVPLVCQIPVVDQTSISIPKKTTEQSDAQFIEKTLDLMTEAFLKAPIETLKTSVLIHKVDNQLIPEMDDPNYFPTAVTNKMTGATEEELNQENAE